MTISYFIELHNQTWNFTFKSPVKPLPLFLKHFIVTDNNENISTNTKLTTLLLFAINEHKQLTRHLIKIYNQVKFKLNNSKHTFTSIILLIEFYINNK
jgi:hypothetical protein